MSLKDFELGDREFLIKYFHERYDMIELNDIEDYKIGYGQLAFREAFTLFSEDMRRLELAASIDLTDFIEKIKDIVVEGSQMDNFQDDIYEDHLIYSQGEIVL